MHPQESKIKKKLYDEDDTEELAKYTGPGPQPLNKSCYCNATECKPPVTPVVTKLT